MALTLLDVYRTMDETLKICVFSTVTYAVGYVIGTRRG